jgi:hypothetical protein
MAKLATRWVLLYYLGVTFDNFGFADFIYVD